MHFSIGYKSIQAACALASRWRCRRRACAALALSGWLLLGVGATTGRAAEPALVIDPQHARFDDAYQFANVRQVFTVTNRGNAPVNIARVEARSGVGEIVQRPQRLAPGEKGDIVVRVPLLAALGESSYRFALFTDETGIDRYRFTLEGFVQSAFEPELAAIDFGTLNRGATPTREIEITSREAGDWAFADVIQKPDFVKVAVNGKRVSVSVADTAPPGWIVDRIVLRTTLPQQSQAAIALTGFVVGELLLENKAVNIGAVEIGHEVRKTFTVRGRNGAALKGQLSARAESPWAASVRDCAVARADCAQIEVRGKPRTAGPMGGTVYLERKQGKDPPLPVRLFGVGLNPGQTIRQVNAADAEAQKEPALNPPPSLQAALAAQTHDPVAAPADDRPAPPVEAKRSASGAGPARLHWSAANDRELYGYIVYRAEDRAGPYLRISRDIVRARKDETKVHQYAFEDDQVVKGKTYYYYVDSISLRGQRARFMPVVEKSVR